MREVVNMAERQAAKQATEPKVESKTEPKVNVTLVRAPHLNTTINHANIQTIQTPDGSIALSMLCGELTSEHLNDDGSKDLTILPKAVLRMDLTFALRLIEVMMNNYPDIERALLSQRERMNQTEAVKPEIEPVH